MWNKTPLRSFLRRQKKSIALQLGCLALFALVFFLYRMPMGALLYALSLCAVLLALALCISFVRYLRTVSYTHLDVYKRQCPGYGPGSVAVR